MAARQQQLEEDNYALRMQVAKLQVALRNAFKPQGDGASSSPSPQEAYVSKEQLAGVLSELADLRHQVAQLQEQNRSLQVQLQDVREAQTVSTSTSGVDEPWTTPPSVASGQDPFPKGDMVFIEREIMCLKQKLSDTRHKLLAAEQPPLDESPFAASGQCSGGAMQRQPQQPLMQYRQAASNRPTILQAIQQGSEAAERQPLHIGLLRGNAQRIPGTPLTRANVAQLAHGKRPTQPTSRLAQENRANASKPKARAKVQRGRATADY